MRARRFLLRWRAFAGIAWAMLTHDKPKLAGGLVGVVFATVLATQATGTFLGLMNKNTMLIRHADADVWVTPPATEAMMPGDRLAERFLYQSAAVEGVAWTAPMLYTQSTVALPQGGGEPITIVGIDPKGLHGGPWNVVAGDPRDLDQPDAIFVEDSYRDRFGGVNLGSVREIGGKRVQVVGLHWGLLPFAPPMSFTSYDKAREIVGLPVRESSFVLVGLEPGQDPDVVAGRLREKFGSDARVFTRDEFWTSAVKYVLTRTPIGVTLGSMAFFGILVGFVIVAIAMFGAVIDNLREFGTLKAIGSRTSDLARILFVQSVIYGLVGSGIGLTLAGFIVNAIRSPNLSLSLPTAFVVGLPFFMVLVCMGASGLALLRLRKLEPGIVFRG